MSFERVTALPALRPEHGDLGEDGSAHSVGAMSTGHRRAAGQALGVDGSG
ncbi:hypothetical protein ABGB12_20275 [Actinocorallia sp. B10E7]